MSTPVTEKGYQGAMRKLAGLQARLADLRKRTDLHPNHRLDVELSYIDQMRQYLRDIQLYETRHGLPLTQIELPTAQSATAPE